VETLESATVMRLAYRHYRDFAKLSPEKMLDFALKPENKEALQLMAEFRRSKTAKWMLDLVENRNASHFLHDILSAKISPEHQKAFLAFCVRNFGSDSNCFSPVMSMMAPRLRDFAKTVADNLGNTKASDAWKAVIGEPAPEGLDELTPKERTERFYGWFVDKVKGALKGERDFNEKDLDNEIQLRLGLIMGVMTGDVDFDLALAINMKNFEKVQLKSFSKFSLYNPETSVKQGLNEVIEQFDRDFERGGARITFGDVKIEVDWNQYRSSEPNSGVRKEVVDAFNDFTFGMSAKQKLTIGFGLTQAGADIHGFIAGNGCASQMTHELRKNDDGSVMLKIIFPEYNGAKPISYTYRVDTEGNSKIVELTYGDKKVAP